MGPDNVLYALYMCCILAQNVPVKEVLLLFPFYRWETEAEKWEHL